MRSATTLDSGGNAEAPIIMFNDFNADGVADALLIGGTRRGEPNIVRDYRVFVAEADGWRLASKGSFSRSNYSRSAAAGAAIRVAMILSMALPSMSMTSNVHPAHSTESPSCGTAPRSNKNMPLKDE